MEDVLLERAFYRPWACFQGGGGGIRSGGRDRARGEVSAASAVGGLSPASGGAQGVLGDRQGPEDDECSLALHVNQRRQRLDSHKPGGLTAGELPPSPQVIEPTWPSRRICRTVSAHEHQEAEKGTSALGKGGHVPSPSSSSSHPTKEWRGQAEKVPVPPTPFHLLLSIYFSLHFTRQEHSVSFLLLNTSGNTAARSQNCFPWGHKTPFLGVRGPNRLQLHTKYFVPMG